MAPAPRHRGLLALIVMILSSVVVTGCFSQSSNTPAQTKQDHETSSPSQSVKQELRVWAGPTAPLTPNFNPFSAGVLPGVKGGVYESLFVFNPVADVDPVPLLATEAQFNEEGTVLTVTLREGVRWSDGRELTVEDVIFSYTQEAIAPHEVADAQKVDDHTVELLLNGPQFNQEARILQHPIVPKHVWRTVGKKATQTTDEGKPRFDNTDNPVGSGPFTVAEVTEDSYVLKANTTYWYEEADLVPRVVYQATEDHEQMRELLASQELDWLEAFLPYDTEKMQNQGFTELNAPIDVIALYTCANEEMGCEGQQTDPAVRQALHAALGREAINEAVYNGLAGPVNLALVPEAGEQKWIGDKVADQDHQQADPQRAEEVLQEAGYTQNNEGLYGKDKPISLDLVVVSDWGDYNHIAALVVEQARAAGIEVTTTTVTAEEFSKRRDEGNFELMLGGVAAPRTIDPYPIYTGWYGGEATQPVGSSLEGGQWNFSRYVNDDVDEALRSATTTEDRDDKLEAYATIQAEITADLPYIPVLTAPQQVFVNSEEFRGWPTEENLYAYPSPVGGMSTGLILRDVHVAK